MVLGGGLAGLSAACYLARSGLEVSLFEKNATVGGKVQYRSRGGFKFNLGPTLYLMHDVFEEFFDDFGIDIEKVIKFKEVHPYFRVFADGQKMDFSDVANTRALLEQKQKDSGRSFKKMMNRSRQLYAMLRLNYFNTAWDGLFKFSYISKIIKLKKFKLIDDYGKFIDRYIKLKPARTLMNLPVAYFNSQPSSAPMFMKAAPQLLLGQPMKVPEDGMLSLIKAIEEIAHNLGVYIKTESPVARIDSSYKQVSAVICADGTEIECDIVVATADYQYVESNLLNPEDRTYSPGYWRKKSYSPAILIIAAAFSQKIDVLKLNNIFQGEDDFYNKLSKKQRSVQPTFYVNVSSRINKEDAPEAQDNLVIQVLLPAGCADDLEYYNQLKTYAYQQISEAAGFDVTTSLIFDEMRAHSYFEKTFNSSLGSPNGLSAKLGQVGPFGPVIKSRAIDGLFYAGQDVSAGSTMAGSINSGKVTAYKILGKKQGRGRAR